MIPARVLRVPSTSSGLNKAISDVNKAASLSLSEIDRARDVRRGRTLEYFTVAWNSAETVIALGAGWVAGSIALVGFGVDSFIETSSGLVLLWRLHSDADATRRAAVEARR